MWAEGSCHQQDIIVNPVLNFHASCIRTVVDYTYLSKCTLFYITPLYFAPRGHGLLFALKLLCLAKSFVQKEFKVERQRQRQTERNRNTQTDRDRERHRERRWERVRLKLLLDCKQQEKVIREVRQRQTQTGRHEERGHVRQERKSEI